MKILIIDQCSKEKDFGEEVTPLDAAAIDNTDLQNLRERSQTPSMEAVKLYAGRQQQFIDDAVSELRDAGDVVDRYFVSAGFGCVEEHESLPPYNVTFAESSRSEVRDRGEKLGIETDLCELVNGEYDVIFFALGRNYYQSFNLSKVLEVVPDETWVVCFNQPSVSDSFSRTVSLSAGNEEAKQHGTIAIALKGKYLQYFARNRSNGRQISSTEDISLMCKSDPDQRKIDDFD